MEKKRSPIFQENIEFSYLYVLQKVGKSSLKKIKNFENV